MSEARWPDRFLDEIAIQNSMQAALQRSGTYSPECKEEDKKELFRRALAERLRKEAQRYVGTVSEAEHCAAIKHICSEISHEFGEQLLNGRLRYGVAQKAFNLYLKFLWKFGYIRTPPHCPIDGIVLRAAKIDCAWTKCDSEEKYLGWIRKLESKAGARKLADWEDSVWSKELSNERIRGAK